ncbi:hypothetical protein F5Y04DRAFT_276326 [Hypomontagnella monticulosa]|nr:hypothetical protein F5Y04DRAFT_276326 [Hypomontagnella monticulosa]
MTSEDSQHNTDDSRATGSYRRAHSPGIVPTPLPQYFIVRPGVTKHTASGMVTKPGPIVPLIAVDQLPEWLELPGVPRELDLEQTVGLTNLGVLERSPEFYEVHVYDSETDSGSSRYGIHQRCLEHDFKRRHSPAIQNAESGLLSPDSGSESTASSPLAVHSRTNLVTATSHSTGRSNDGNKMFLANTKSLHCRIRTPTAATNKPPSNARPFIHTYPQLHTSPPSSPYIPYTPSSSPYPPRTNPYRPSPSLSLSSTTAPRNRSTVTPTPINTPLSTTSNVNSVYCRHWCHRGTCRWGAHCRYAHAMPTTAGGLREVGLTHHPAWYAAAMSMAYGGGGDSSASGISVSGLSVSGGKGGEKGGGGVGSVVWYPSPPRNRGRRAGGRRGPRGKGNGKGKGKEKVEGGKGKGKGRDLDVRSGGSEGSESSSESETGDVAEEKLRVAGNQGKAKPGPQREPEKLVEV